MLGYIQYKVGKWLLAVNKAGQAALMAHEAWRSLCMPIVIVATRSETITIDGLQKYERRQTADVTSISILKKKYKNDTDVLKAFESEKKQIKA